MTFLFQRDLADLRSSGLTDATIALSGCYTELDPVRLSKILRWSRPAGQLGGGLVIPYFHSNSKQNGFARVKPHIPRKDRNGKSVKYEQPIGISPHALITPLAEAAIDDTSVDLLLTEGEKKAWAIFQVGFAAIGLSGVWAWQKPVTFPRKLIDDLAQVVWKSRKVVIIFDTDSKRNPNVNYALAELVRTLTELGAVVFVLNLPIGPRDANGVPGKMAADDFIVKHGEDAFRRLVRQITDLPPPPRSLADYRNDLAKNKLDSVGTPGIFLDTSPTGAGKSFSDTPAAKKAGKSLTILQTHKQSREVKERYIQSGMNAATYPELSGKTCRNFEEAEKVLGVGLSPSAAICPSCIYANDCDYRESMVDAEEADHRIGTQRRAQLSLENMAAGRQFITIHENPADVLKPTAEITCGLDKVAEVARAAKDNERGREDLDLYRYFLQMENVAHDLIEKLHHADNTTPLSLPPPISPPRLVDAKLYSAMQTLQIFPDADAVRIVRAVVDGVVEVVIRVDRIFSPGRQVVTKKSIIAVWQTKLPDESTIWLSDATTDPLEVELLLPGHSVVNKTPAGRLEQLHDAVQIPIDVKQGTRPSTVVKLLRGVLLAFPNAQRIGIICHREHVSTIKGTAHKGPVLDEALRRRIAKIEYYHSGEGRGSNRWIDECDLILVLGTPRLPPHAVKCRLIQTGRIAAATRDGEWDRDYWSGGTVEGRRRTIRTLAYRDHDWYQAHRSLVHAELIQAVGRGRSICPNGVEVVVVSNESLNLPLLDFVIEPLSKSSMEALKTVYELSAQNPIYILEFCADKSVSNSLNSPLEFCAVSTFQVATHLKLRDRRVRYILDDLLRRQLVNRIGQRGGWTPTEPGKMICTQPNPLSNNQAAAGSPGGQLGVQ